ncbi:progestin and adipoQ receptor family member 3-like [Styela clava]
MKTTSTLSFQGFSSVPSLHLRHVRSLIHLFPYEEVPRHMQGNPHITAGYRCYLSARQCLKSMFVLSNELVNIWTHLGMALAWIFLLLYDQLVSLPSAGAGLSDHFVHLTYVLCIQICMVSSAGYHIFNSHTLENVCLRWYAIDLAGIITGVLGCYIPGLHYAFYCFPYIKLLYLVSVAALIGISIFMVTQPLYLSHAWTRYRMSHIITLVLYGIVPSVHWVFISSRREIELFLPNVMTMYLILAIAFSFYLSQFPERFLPGKFNLIGQSHNLWHVLTAFSFIYWRHVALHIMLYRVENECSIDQA